LRLKRGSCIGVQHIRKRCATFSIEHDQPNGTIRKEGMCMKGKIKCKEMKRKVWEKYRQLKP
jgi:hypothetical protein